MKKNLISVLFLLVMASNAYSASLKPEVSVEVDSENTIHVSAENTTEYNLRCKYAVTRLLNLFNIKVDYGTVSIKSGDVVSFDVKNGEFDYVYFPRAVFHCK